MGNILDSHCNQNLKDLKAIYGPRFIHVLLSTRVTVNWMLVRAEFWSFRRIRGVKDAAQLQKREAFYCELLWLFHVMLDMLDMLDSNPISKWYILGYTSGTAQGGGGSFRHRKPIGEVGCCESRRAERIHWWTERWLELCFLEWLQWLQWSPHHNCWM